MVKKFKRVFKALWAWDDEKEEVWLREMAQKGWLLRSYLPFLYTFESCEPKDYIYKLDYKATLNSDIDEYLAIFEDAGWEHVYQFGGWHYFRAQGDKNLPDIYSDNASKIQKYKGLLRVIGIITISNLGLGLNTIFNNNSYMDIKFRIFYAGLLLFLTYGVIRIALKIKRLKGDVDL